MLTVLDTRTGLNSTRKADLSLEVEVKPSVGPFADICDANNKPLSLDGVVQLPALLGNRLSLVEFLVFSKLAVPPILGGDYCEKFVEAIRPRVKLVELDDGSTVPIVRKAAQLSPVQNTCRVEVSHLSRFEQQKRPHAGRPFHVLIGNVSKVPKRLAKP